MDITTTYLGLKLASPLIVGSSGLTGSVDKITAFARHGAGAVVLKSIFEEEILFEYEDIIKEAQAEGVNLDQFDYYDYHLKGKRYPGHRQHQLHLLPRVDRLCRPHPGGRRRRVGAEHVLSALRFRALGPGAGGGLLPRHR